MTEMAFASTLYPASMRVKWIGPFLLELTHCEHGDHPGIAVRMGSTRLVNHLTLILKGKEKAVTGKFTWVYGSGFDFTLKREDAQMLLGYVKRGANG